MTARDAQTTAVQTEELPVRFLDFGYALLLLSIAPLLFIKELDLTVAIMPAAVVFGWTQIGGT